MKRLKRCLFILFIGSLYVSLSCQLTGQFWQLTDVHWDLNYTRFGGNPKNMCWSQPLNYTFGGKYPQIVDVGRFGNYNCDSPWSLVISTLQFMKKKQPKPDFILWTGDDGGHTNDYFFSQSKVFNIMKTLTTAIDVTFPKVPIFPTFGNHESYPDSYFSPNSGDPWYVLVAGLWRRWLGEQAYETFKLGGYYQKPHPVLPNVIIVALNTAIYTVYNELVQSNIDLDPTGQFSWLENTLQQIAAKNQKAYLTSHVPPGYFGNKLANASLSYFQIGYNERFSSIVTKYADTILGQFYGHVHTDAFKLFYDSQGNPNNMVLMSPSVTPWNSSEAPNNPGVRLYTYDLRTGKILNYKQYYLNLTKANRENKADWQLEYDFLQTYNLPDMSYSSLNKLAQTFATTNRTYFNKYYQYYTVSYLLSSATCNADCQKTQYCAVVGITQAEFNKCTGTSTG